NGGTGGTGLKGVRLSRLEAVGARGSDWCRPVSPRARRRMPGSSKQVPSVSRTTPRRHGSETLKSGRYRRSRRPPPGWRPSRDSLSVMLRKLLLLSLPVLTLAETRTIVATRFFNSYDHRNETLARIRPGDTV